MYTEKELKKITEKLVRELKTLPDGTEMTTCRLIELAGMDTDSFDVGELMDLSQSISIGARKQGIYLDWSRSIKMLEKLPFVLEFTVVSQVA
ncbi:MAG: hypothetical protein IJL78_00910 [Lachnospiraceae bacterium]|nr:hypothetical protein [Lachnospiraceae bacterium]